MTAPPYQFLLGLLVAAVIGAHIATGQVGTRSGPPLSKERAPVAFWTINALLGICGAYLIYDGVTRWR